MTVAEIQEYIAESIKDASEFSTPKHRIIRYLRKIYSMLDELELNKQIMKDIKWIRDTSHGMVRYQCDNCKNYKTLAYNFCPDCGAKMKVIKTTKENKNE